MSSSRVPSLFPSSPVSSPGANAPGGTDAGKCPAAKDPSMLSLGQACGSTKAADGSGTELPTEMSSAVLPDDVDDAGNAAAVRPPYQQQQQQQLKQTPGPGTLDGLRTRSYSTGGIDMDDSDDDNDGKGESGQRSFGVAAVQPASIPVKRNDMDEAEDDVDSMYEDDEEEEEEDAEEEEDIEYDPEFLEAFQRDQARIAQKERETQGLIDEVRELNKHLALSEELLLNLKRRNEEEWKNHSNNQEYANKNN